MKGGSADSGLGRSATCHAPHRVQLKFDPAFERAVSIPLNRESSIDEAEDTVYGRDL